MIKLASYLFLFFWSWTSIALRAQELNCQVVINAQQIETTERQIFEEMETEFENFLNDKKWSDDRFDNQERIRCVFQITLESQPEIGLYSGALQVISVRPVYNSSYESTLINFADRDFDFEYTQSQPMNFNEASFQSNITSVLGYYALMILGYDFDSFGNLGGNDYFRRAQQVVSSAQNSNFSGWNQFNSIRNRYWWLDNVNDQIMQPFREAFYEYHRKGLDIMVEQPEEARLAILEALKKIQTVNRSKPRSIMAISFLDAKADELVSIFSQGDMAVRRQAYEILIQLDPARTDTFKEILNN